MYGGGPELSRKVVAVGETRQLKIELSPNKFQVVRADVDGSPMSVRFSIFVFVYFCISPSIAFSIVLFVHSFLDLF